MLADLIREARAVGMTNVDIARVCGVHETTGSRGISGAKSPSVGHLQPLADDLGMVLAPASG
jgi:transcriptional regulator with XRE-family HTH domain